MKALTVQPKLVEQVRDAILDEIAAGDFAPGDRIIQEQDAPGRGLLVAPLDADHVRHMYDIRAVIEGLAAGLVSRRIAADMKFHEFIYGLSANPLIAPALETHLTYTQRVMGEVLNNDDKPCDIWDQHETILQAVAQGQGERAEALVRAHLTQAAEFMVARLRGRLGAPAA